MNGVQLSVTRPITPGELSKNKEHHSQNPVERRNLFIWYLL